MKIETLKERIEKAEERIEKKKNTIAKKNKSIEKKSGMLLKKHGLTEWKTFNRNTDRNKYSEIDFNEIWWTVSDIEMYIDDIQRLNTEIKEIENTLEKYKAQMSGELERENIFNSIIPECMKELEKELVIEWDRWDRKRRTILKDKYNELGYKKFLDSFNYSDYKFMKKSDSEIHESNIKFAHSEVFDLYYRVKNITGEVVDWSGISLSSGNVFPVLTGIVVGKEGRCKVETILAGGYNIQKLHIRTLVHSLE